VDIKRPTLWLDYETYCPLDLRKVGLDAYSAHPECEVLLAAWAVDDGPIYQWDATKDSEPPADLVELLRDNDVLVEAWNAPFERYITERVLRIGVTTERWRDTMVRAYHAGLPGKLETAGKALGIPKQKLETGTRLVRKFCAPRRPTKKNPATRNLPEDHPEDWEEFCEYNRRDVEAQRLVASYLPPVPDFIWEEWFLDQKINDRGIPINLRMARNAADLYDVEKERLMDIVRERTGLAKPNHAPSMLAWAQARGYPGRDMRAATIAAALEQAEDMDPFLRETLQIYQKASLTSPKKYRAIERSIGPGNRLRGAFQFYGAMRTGRWAGRTFQPQNLPRPPKWLMEHYDETADLLEVVDEPAVLELMTGGEPIEVLKGMIRAVAQAPEGYVLVDADYSAIENRVVGWLAGESKILRVFAEGKDPYIDFATRLFNTPYEVIKAECDAGDKSKRTLAKPAVLGAAYRLGPGRVERDPATGMEMAKGLLGYAWSMGVKLTERQSAEMVEVFRSTYRKVTTLWYDLDDALEMCVRDGRRVRVGKLLFELGRRWMRIRLPSGRHLYYYKPRWEEVTTPWGDRKMQVTYMAQQDGKWMRVSTHGGKIVENCVQAIARDLLAYGLRKADEAGLDIRLHIHDQIVCVAPEEKAEEALETLVGIMSQKPDWAKGLPLSGDGFICKKLRKD